MRIKVSPEILITSDSLDFAVKEELISIVERAIMEDDGAMCSIQEEIGKGYVGVGNVNEDIKTMIRQLAEGAVEDIAQFVSFDMEVSL